MDILKKRLRAILNASGKLLREPMVETKAATPLSSLWKGCLGN